MSGAMTYERALDMLRTMRDYADADATGRTSTMPYDSLSVTSVGRGSERRYEVMWWDARLGAHFQACEVTHGEVWPYQAPTLSDALVELVAHASACYEWERRARAESLAASRTLPCPPPVGCAPDADEGRVGKRGAA